MHIVSIDGKTVEVDIDNTVQVDLPQTDWNAVQKDWEENHNPNTKLRRIEEKLDRMLEMLEARNEQS